MSLLGQAHKPILIIAVAAAVTALLPTTAGAAPASIQHVAPVQSSPHGATYAQWSARWWQWAFSTPATPEGPFGEGAVDCGQQQPNRKVWFLTGPHNTSGMVERTCTIPPGTALFFPLLNVECSDQEPAPFFGATAAERQVCVQQNLFQIANLSATVDGQPVEDLGSYIVISPDFAFVAAEGNPTGVTMSGNSTSRGAFLMLNPLPRGEHTISFSGTFPEFPFTATTTYHITVEQ